jgi:multidrug efflux pump subunit AcrA (membrane-fusion protein)
MVREILIEVHDQVERGQLLLRLDTRLERETLASQVSIKDRLKRENADISALLGASDVAAGVSSSSLFVRKQQAELQIEAGRANNAGIEQQIGALRAKIDYAEQQLEQMNGRATRYASLSNQGFARLIDQEQIAEQMLIIRGEIEADRVKVFELQTQIERNLQQQELTRVGFEYELTSLREKNLAQLDQIEATILDLEDRIDRSDVRAPESGVVASLPISAEHMMAARGATLLTLARPLEQARVTFDVPVSFIDQIGPGMTGRLIIPSLPARQMPKIDLQIDAISPRAILDDAGNPVSYAGLALASFDVLERLEDVEGVGNLSEDMPITLIVMVRETTFANYLIAPLVNAFSRALQD